MNQTIATPDRTRTPPRLVAEEASTATADAVIIGLIGDLRFGMGPHHQAYLDAIESVCAEFGLLLACINGNHENWARLDQLCTQPVADTIRNNPWGWPDSILAYAQEGIDRFTRAVAGSDH